MSRAAPVLPRVVLSRVVLPRVVVPALAALLLVPVAVTGPSAADSVDPVVPAAVPASTGARPNILMVRTDDQVMDRLTRMKQYMPQTAAFFAASGREFTNSYVSSPSCCQSRASTFVGRYPHNEGVWSQGRGYTLDTRGGIAPYLRRAGYRTALVGKYLNLIYKNVPGFDWYTSIRGACSGSTQTEDCSGATAANWYYNFAVTSNHAADPSTDFVVRGDPRTGAGYNTTWSGTRLRSYLGAAISGASDGKPWYVEWDPTAPHTHDSFATMPLPKYKTLPVPGCQPPVEADRSDKPDYVQAFTKVNANLAKDKVCPAAQRTLRSIDDEFGRVLAQLRQAGVLSNTLVVFTSDNGLMNGEHLLSRKFVPYEPSVRVPLLISWPGHVAVGTDTRLVSNIDLLPTVLQAAGVVPDPALPVIDGRSLLRPGGHTQLLSEYRVDPGWSSPEPARIPTWASITDLRATYIETYTDKAGTAIGFREYYDLVKDPGQLTNLLADGVKGNDPDVAALHARLARQRTCVGASGRNPCL